MTRKCTPQYEKQAVRKQALPVFCDFGCPHAEFGDPAAVGACRRDVGVWCTIAKQYNNKNARCIVRSER